MEEELVNQFIIVERRKKRAVYFVIHHVKMVIPVLVQFAGKIVLLTSEMMGLFALNPRHTVVVMVHFKSAIIVRNTVFYGIQNVKKDFMHLAVASVHLNVFLI